MGAPKSPVGAPCGAAAVAKLALGAGLSYQNAPAGLSSTHAPKFAWQPTLILAIELVGVHGRHGATSDDRLACQPSPHSPWHAAVPLKKAAAATSSPSHAPNPKRPGLKLPGRLCWYHVPLAAGPYHRVALYMSSRVRLEGLGRPFEARGGQIRRQTSHLYRDSQHSNSRRGSATTQARIVSRCITGRATTHRCSPPSLPNPPASPRLCQAGGRPGSRRQSSLQHPS